MASWSEEVRMARVADPEMRRHREILAISCKLFASKGYHATSMSEIADAAKLNKGTLYHYFRSKADILHAVYSTIVEAIADRVGSIPHDSTPPEALRLVIQHILELHAERPRELEVYFQEQRHLAQWLPKAQVKALRNAEGQFMKQVVGIIDSGIASGYFRPVESKLAAFGVIGVVAWATQWFDPRGAYSLTDVATAFGDLTIGGLAAEKRPRRRP
jgi:AcrR family transcriptional regulator